MGTEDILKIVKKIGDIDGKVVGEDQDFIKAKMGKNNKEAWINRIVEQKLKGEKIDIPPSEYGITKKDIIKEIAKREIEKAFGKG
jgi:hypothetical protein